MLFRSKGGKTYPLADRKDWTAAKHYDERGGKLTHMSPDEFLDRTRPLDMDDKTQRSIDAYKGMMDAQHRMNPLQLLANGLEDGRHRATAAKELGIDSVPVVDFRASGGEVWNKPRPKKLGKPEPLSSKEKASAKAAAKAAGRPYPNLIDNMRAARADGGELPGDRAHEFVQEQLQSGEPQVPQYVAENDFPARAARGVEAADTAAARVNNILASAAGMEAMRSPEGRSASEIVQAPLPVDPYKAVQQAAGQWREGDKLGAAETMATAMPMQGAIRMKYPLAPRDRWYGEAN